MEDRSWFNLFINPRIQLRFLFLILLAGLLGAGLFGAFIGLQQRIIAKLAQKPGQLEQINALLWDYGLLTVVVFGLGLALIFFFGLFFTHRLIGPVRRLKDRLETMQEKEQIQLCQVRETDYLHPFFKKLNRVLINARWEESGTSNKPGETEHPPTRK